MKLLLSRAFVLVIFSLLMVCGILIFTVNYFSSASTWVQFPANRHLYANGKLLSQGTVYDRAGNILLRMDEGNHDSIKIVQVKYGQVLLETINYI